MTRMKLENLLAAQEVIAADGGMGTMLMALGLRPGETPELWNVERVDDVRGIQRGYIEAGAQIILTNTFGGNRQRLGHRNLEERVDELNRTAAALACEEAEAAAGPVVVGGSIGPSGKMMAPLGDLTYEEATATFEEQAAALVAGGVDVLWVETMSDLNELRAAVEGCRRAAPGFPVTGTMTFDTRGHTSMGVSTQMAVAAFAEMGLLAFGGNCGNGPQEIEGVIGEIRALAPKAVLIAKSNAGMPRLEGDRQVYDATPEIMAEHALRVRDLGARIIGACCGSTPDHIRAMAEALKA
jgi:5-methyltetrahydrofolate--homocysteine methyltransferase